MIKKRDSKFELLRIIAMIFIILTHYSANGNWSDTTDYNKVIHLIFFPLGQIGVYLFVMLSGYFLSSREINEKASIKRVIPLWVKTIFYSWLFLIINCIFQLKPIGGFKGALVSLCPIMFNNYWFMTCFILLMLITPILNQIIQSFSQKQYKYYLFIFILFIDVIPLIKSNNMPFGGVWSVSILAVAYLVSGYIRKYNLNINKFIAIIFIIVGLSGEYISIIVLKSHPFTGSFENQITKFCYGIFPLLVSIGIFSLVRNAKSFYSSIINFFAGNVLASYLITDNVYFKNFFWNKLLNVGRFNNYIIFVLLGIILSLVVILLCSVLDKIYDKIYSYVVRMLKIKRIKI